MLKKIGFIGLGNMGGPMAANLLKAGYEVAGFDLDPNALAAHDKAGGVATSDLKDVVEGAFAVVTMLPAGPHVRQVYMEEGGILDDVPPGTLLIDCSTIDVASARVVANAAAERGHFMVDAPVSGGVAGAQGGKLTFMVGGPEEAFNRAKPLLEVMGQTIVHAGGPGTGQAAKICNNMLLGISMIGVCEAFNLAESLGLEAQSLFDIASKSSGQCWSLTSYCPVPGPVETSPANNEYRPGFAGAMMLKDLKLAQLAAEDNGAKTPMGAKAEALYQAFCDAGGATEDFSAMVRWLKSV
ncbi:3-hydroxyisobutyrate dehydrogenase [Roseibium limicola]|uniref:3-hydroxyisobutyrate dehydrogenase n=1 Tax=Roseibium limicola TaxID=2816037 RepID=A0A939J7B0_9HYPH|nr:3-hydroxyisobutyrate dehydrogenase [Roseibium limicola]MBO0345982.1 3-hydroxyisobutyrate dehydrogenase [Roseibium limicola]